MICLRVRPEPFDPCGLSRKDAWYCVRPEPYVVPADCTGTECGLSRRSPESISFQHGF